MEVALSPEFKRKLYASPIRRLLKPLVNGTKTIGFMSAVCRGRWQATPHHIKVQLIRSHLRCMNNPAFVETGTYLGDTLESVRALCSKAVSIEIDPFLHELALKRFRGYPQIELVRGDCVSMLPKVLAGVDRPALFWLDAHYSSGITGRGEVDDPILFSLRQLSQHALHSHVVLIDDARSFDGRESRPDLVDVLRLLKDINPSYRVSVQHDVVIAE